MYYKKIIYTVEEKYNTNQIILVTKKNNLFNLEIYEKNNNKWIQILSTISRVGRNGITNDKKEGDGKTPIGMYTLGDAFGVAEKPITEKKYLKLNDEYYLVDDSNSVYYNKLVNINNVLKDWESAEHLIEYKTAYEYALVINYNEECIKYKGSAIFLHCDTGNDTSGCISVNREDMLFILKCIKNDAIIVIL